jgi:hypothetical protein
MDSKNNRLVMILAATVVVLLIAFVAMVVLNSGTPATNTATNPGNTSTTPTATSNPGMGSSTGTEFDATKATKVPADSTPDAFVSAYYQAILDGKWDDAFKMQPAASQTGSVADFQATQEMYGMTSFKIASKDIGDAEATVVVEQDLGQNGIWNATWTFTKEGGDWLVKARKVGMGAVK